MELSVVAIAKFMFGLNVFSLSKLKLYSRLYEAFYHLKACPFPLAAEYKCIDSFPHRTYEKTKTYLEYALGRGEGFIVVTGDSGIGKTTLVNELVKQRGRNDLLIAKVNSKQMQAYEVLRKVTLAFGLNGDGGDKSTLLPNLKNFISNRKQIGHRALLIVDGGEDLSAEAMEEIRLLSVLQEKGEPLMQVVLLGEDKLWDVIRSPGMEQLHQRLLATCHLEALTGDETTQYIRHCLQMVGWKGDPILSNTIFPLIYEFSGGVPRLINILCGWSLYASYMNDKHELGVKEVQQAIEELREERVTPCNENRTAGYTIDTVDKTSEMSKGSLQYVEISVSHKIDHSTYNASTALETHTVESSKPKKRRFWSSWV